MTPIRSAAVFCGSRVGADPIYAEATAELGRGLALAGITLVYGGGRIGLMGIIADAMLAAGGQVHGIIPDFLQRREVAHGGATRMEFTPSMHTRKARMFELADAFVTMPGGLGTFDETIEVVTWRQLGLHDKPILICDVAGWARPLLAVLRTAVEDGFADASALELFEVVPDVPALLARLAAPDTLPAEMPGAISPGSGV
ncbi:MAG: TIGR00730 family Rossman fold protein [Acetobacteraceae bacterium]|nr:TIGR00730 family Rossman fold protein [Acetobacteraceae bacterium]